MSEQWMINDYESRIAALQFQNDVLQTEIKCVRTQNDILRDINRGLIGLVQRSVGELKHSADTIADL